jgi:hypothetical protein|nr:MAG TPA: hypothetical protein [Caudoviricetes sp.]
MPYPSPADELEGDLLNLVLFLVDLVLLLVAVPMCLIGLL